MELVWNYLKDTVLYVLGTLLHNLPALVLGVLIAAAIQTYINPDRMRNWLMRRSSVSIPTTVAFGAFTPFCACGTMVVVISMLATSLPWGPIMAFLTSSPLMSPEGFVLISGIISPTFAIALAAASIIIGIGSDYITHIIEKKTHFLKDQLRIVSAPAASADCGCSAASNSTPTVVSATCCNSVEESSECGQAKLSAQGYCGVIAAHPPKANRLHAFLVKYKLDQLFKAAFNVGVKKILPYFALFAGIGYLINRFIPSEWISVLFGSDNAFAIPLSAVVGLPLYVNGDSSLPLIQSLMQSGVSGGAMLAFMITGPGTSAGVLAGIATIMKKKAIALYVAFLLGGAILLGYAYELVLALIR